MPSTAISPRIIALATFAFVLAIGAVIFSVASMDHDAPAARTDQLGRVIGICGVVAAAVAYLVQRKRLLRETPEMRSLN